MEPDDDSPPLPPLTPLLLLPILYPLPLAVVIAVFIEEAALTDMSRFVTETESCFLLASTSETATVLPVAGGAAAADAPSCADPPKGGRVVVVVVVGASRGTLLELVTFGWAVRICIVFE